MNDKRKERAARAEQMRKERERQERRQRNLITVAFVVVIIALIAGVTFWYVEHKPESEEPIADPPSKLVTPDNVTDDYGIELKAEDTGGETADNAPRVVAYEDFQCPHCKTFEDAAGEYLTDKVADGDIVLEYRVLGFFDQMSGNEYSTRAANAAVCVLEDTDATGFKKMHDALFADQPEENTDGPQDSELVSLAEDAGDDDADSCIKERTYHPWVEKAGEAANDDNVEQTPTVQVDGKELDDPSPDNLDKAIKAASN